MIVDAHQHFWIYKTDYSPWISKSMEILKKDYLPLKFPLKLHSNSVDVCIAIQASQTEQETQFLLDLASQYSYIKGVIGWLDLLADNFESKLGHYSKNQNFKGIRHIIQAEPKGFMLQEKFLDAIGKIGKYNLIYEILIYPNQFKEAIEMVAQFPTQKFILNHIAKPNLSKKIDDDWKKNIEKLAEFKNVYCKFSGLVTETENFNWNYNQIVPFLEVVIKAFGSQRILFGSDYPVCLLAASYNDVFEIVNKFIAKLSEIERNNILRYNALKFYNINM